MPANLTPQYHKAEQVYKEARTVEEKVAALEEMLAVIPKHKGTDHLQADLKKRLARLKEEASRPKSKKAAFDPFRVEKGGAGQVLLLGAPNSGKSAVVARMTKAATEPTPFPFATQAPIPGMMPFEDIHVQLVDLPPVTADHFPGGLLGLIKSADGILLVADLSSDAVLDDMESLLAHLEDGRVRLRDPARPPAAAPVPSLEDVPAGLIVTVPALLLGTKSDVAGAAERLGLVRELYEERFEPIPLSTASGEGYEEFPRRVFLMLDRVRVYSKEPGKAVDRTSPFVLKRGDTVVDLAARIHRDFPEHLKQARVWGSARFEGQAVERNYPLADGDVVELNVDL
jgi:ribosome-interacting GTPase 1